MKARGHPPFGGATGSISSQPKTLNLLQCLALRFRQASLDEKEAEHTDSCIDPKCLRSTQAAVQQRKRVGEDEACHPERAHRNRHRGATDTVWEYFRDHHPDHWSQ